MSDLEEKTEKCSAEDNKTDCECKQENTDKVLGLGVIFFLVAFAFCFLAGWFIFPKLLYSKSEQPFNFNHNLHVSELGSCDACHYFREDGSFTGVPKLSACIDCHQDTPMGDTKDEEIFCQEYVANNKEVPWLIYAKQPDCVFFSHVAHTEFECKTCHGDIGETTYSRPYEKNRITGYSRDIWGKNIWGFKKHSWDSMKMDDCAKCHKEETGSKGACFQCHK